MEKVEEKKKRMFEFATCGGIGSSESVICYRMGGWENNKTEPMNI